MIKLKIIVIGDMSTGKTCISQRYVTNVFNDSTESTIGVEFVSKVEDKLFPEKNINVYLWDTTGNERFFSITRSFYRQAIACIIVYDITNRKSFDDVSKWVRDIKDHKGNINILLLGNKKDIEGKKREVSYEEGYKYASKNDMIFYEVSAKTGENINKSIQELVIKVNNDKDDNYKSKNNRDNCIESINDDISNMKKNCMCF